MILTSSSSKISSSSSTYSGAKSAALRFLSISLFLYFFNWRSITSSTSSIDTYISLLSCSLLMIWPLTGIVTSIFCCSFWTLSVTWTSVSEAKNLSSLPSFSSTASLSPSVTTMFLPVIMKRIIPSPYLLLADSRLYK